MRDEAVSPVIGVTLMVAITVILAAIIAVFVFGMSTDVEMSKIVSCTGHVNHNGFDIIYHGGIDALSVVSLTFMLDSEEYAPVGVQEFGADPEVGEIFPIECDFSDEELHTLVVVAEFEGGSEQVIYQMEHEES